ncbi:MAG: hypothetical protein WC551_12770 [Patescibacteria group bacterium]
MTPEQLDALEKTVSNALSPLIQTYGWVFGGVVTILFAVIGYLWVRQDTRLDSHGEALKRIEKSMLTSEDVDAALDRHERDCRARTLAEARAIGGGGAK